VQVPVFLNRQVLVIFSAVKTVVPSGRVMSSTNIARLHFGSSVADGRGVIVNVEVSVTLGVKVTVLDGVLVGVLLGVNVGVSTGVLVGVLLGVKVTVLDGVMVGVLLGVNVGVSTGVLVGVLLGVKVTVLDGVMVGVLLGVNVGVVVCEGVKDGVCVKVGVNNISKQTGAESVRSYGLRVSPSSS